MQLFYIGSSLIEGVNLTQFKIYECRIADDPDYYVLTDDIGLRRRVLKKDFTPVCSPANPESSLMDLIIKQNEAIILLTDCLESLEERLLKLESKERYKSIYELQIEGFRNRHQKMNGEA